MSLFVLHEDFYSNCMQHVAMLLQSCLQDIVKEHCIHNITSCDDTAAILFNWLEKDIKRPLRERYKTPFI